MLTSSKNQQILKKYSTEIVINAYVKTVLEIFQILSGNALKYSSYDTEIVVTAEEDSEKIIFGFHDNDEGLTKEDSKRNLR